MDAAFRQLAKEDRMHDIHPLTATVRCARATGQAHRARRLPAWPGACVVALCWLMASLACSAGELPAWPADGVAERRFSAGEAMFIEERGDGWHAWVLPEPSEWTAPARDDPRGPGLRGGVLDFFTGAIVDAELHEDALGHARRVFFSVDGVHAPSRIGGGSAVSRGLLRGGRLLDLEFADGDRLDASRLEGCATRHMVVDRIDPATRAARWSRLVLRRSPPTPECPHGRWSSQVAAVLDLHDGTFLAVLDDRVVRLDAGTLAPVGTGAEVHVVDLDVVRTILQAGGDMHERLNAALPPASSGRPAPAGPGAPEDGDGDADDDGERT